MKYLISLIFSICFISTATAVTIEMLPDEKHGINIPKYRLDFEDEALGSSKSALTALANSDNFPISSKKQGSVFYKIFSNIKENARIRIDVLYHPEKYFDLVQSFERGQEVDFDLLFGVYYKELPYSRNQYVFPALMTNNVHLITAVQKKLDVSKREDLKNYKGMRIRTDKVSDMVAKDFATMKLQIAEDFDEAYEELLTGKIDYIVASYYPSLLAAYSLGIKKYIAYSQEPLWRMPIFIRYHASLKNKAEIKVLSDYLKSSQYKKLRESVFQELIDVYKANTSGVVPPTYIKFMPEENTTQSNDEEQTLEN